MNLVLGALCVVIVGWLLHARWRQQGGGKLFGRVDRQAIDIDEVIDAKYPNRRRREDHWLERDGDGIGDLSEAVGADDADLAELEQVVTLDALDGEADLDLDLSDLDELDLDDDTAILEAARAALKGVPAVASRKRGGKVKFASPSMSAPPAAATQPLRRSDGDVPAGTSAGGGAGVDNRPGTPLVATGFPVPVGHDAPWVPLPGEPDDDMLVRSAEAAPAPTPVVPIQHNGDPFQQLRRRRDRVAEQAAEAFQEVHKLRTEALRRASQAEHNASLATTARTRAGRMVRDTRKVEAQGRRRPVAVPTADDAYTDVHRFRTEALKRSQQAEHGAQRVAQARERANRLLAEQREIEAEMAKLTRLRNAATAE